MYQRSLRVVAITAALVGTIAMGMPRGVAQAHTALPATPAQPVVISNAAPVEPMSPAAIELMQTDVVTSEASPLVYDGFGDEISAGIQQFAGDCVYGGISMYDSTRGANRPGGWFGQYWGTANLDIADLPASPRPFVYGGVPAPFIGWDSYFGMWGSAYAGSSTNVTTTTSVNLLSGNPVYYTCDDDLDYDFRTKYSPTEWYGAINSSFGARAEKTIYDANNNNVFTGEPLVYLDNDNWAAAWTGMYHFNVDSSQGYLTVKVPGENGGGVRTVRLYGLYAVVLRVNDGGAWRIDGLVPDTKHNWDSDDVFTFFYSDGGADPRFFHYDPWQDRKETVEVGFALNSLSYLNNAYDNGVLGLGDIAFNSAGTATGFTSVMGVDYYQKDGPARVGVTIVPLVDGALNVAGDTDAVVDAMRDWFNNNVLPDGSWADDQPLTVPVETDTTTPLSPDDVVSTVYLPLAMR